MSQRQDFLSMLGNRFAGLWMPLIASFLLLAGADVRAQVCATPGVDGTTFARNTYFPGASSVAAGATSSEAQSLNSLPVTVTLLSSNTSTAVVCSVRKDRQTDSN